jgi:glycosyltransferase involved in cell wall biosynthesis
MVGLMAGHVARTPVRILTRHHSDYHTRINKRWHMALDRLTTRLSHAVVAVSEHTRDHLIAVEGAPPHKVVVVHNGIDFNRVRSPDPNSRARIRNEFGAENSYLLLAVGRMHPEKGYQQLFRAMAGIKARADRPVHLLIAGTGPLLEYFRAEADRYGCGAEIKFLGFRNDVMDLMAAADLMVHCAVAEAFGLVLAEAVYLGTPVVATRVGGIPEIITDGLDGVLVPPTDSSALADAVIDLLQNPARRRRMIGAGREKIQDRFRFETMVQRYEALYEEMNPTRPTFRTGAVAAGGVL